MLTMTNTDVYATFLTAFNCSFIFVATVLFKLINLFSTASPLHILSFRCAIDVNSWKWSDKQKEIDNCLLFLTINFAVAWYIFSFFAVAFSHFSWRKRMFKVCQLKINCFLRYVFREEKQNYIFFHAFCTYELRIYFCHSFIVFCIMIF